VSESHLQKRAKAKQERGLCDSPLEVGFRDLLRERGLVLQPQVAIGRYNTDFAIDTVAVEVRGGGHDLRAWTRLHKRLKHFCDAGYTCLVFAFNSRSWLLSSETADYAHTVINEARRNPPNVSEYRVIWGAGDFVFTRSVDSDNLSCVPTPGRSKNPTGGRYKSVPR
jgi:very-short-patch-repair endonuclease